MAKSSFLLIFPPFAEQITCAQRTTSCKKHEMAGHEVGLGELYIYLEH